MPNQKPKPIGLIKILITCATYRDCSYDSMRVGTANENDVYGYYDVVNSWFKLGNNNWIPKFGATDPSKILLEQTDEPQHGTPTPNEPDTDASYEELFKYYANRADTAIANLMDSAKYSLGSKEATRLLSFESMGYMHGMPYQFAPWVDIRPDVLNRGKEEIMINNYENMKIFGRKYAERIGTRTPMLIIAAGDPLYLGGASEEETSHGIEAMIAGDPTLFAEGAKESTSPRKYYAFRNSGAQYFKYVTTLCHAAAINMDLYNGLYEGFNGTDKCRYYNKEISDVISSMSSDYNSSPEAQFANSLTFKNSVAFYVNSDTQVSESLSNSTAPSMLADQINQISNMGRELQFLLGASSSTLSSITDNAKNMGTAGLENLTQNIAESGSLINTIASSMSNIVAGGKMIFPEIWSDSAFGRDYQVSIKLTSPDNDDLSLYHNIIVPLMHLLALALPRGSSSNSYIAPFLVRAAYKSFFHIDMGIITSMSITRGAEGCWNQRGIPTMVEVQIGFKELYGIMNLAQATFVGLDNSYDIMQNDMLLTYISNMCGMNVITDDVNRYITMYVKMKTNGGRYNFELIDEALKDYLATRINRFVK